jgi:flagellar assembly protein FliH
MTPTRSRILSQSDTDLCKPWELPGVQGTIVEEDGVDVSVALPTAQEIEAINREAYEEGFAMGRKEGRAQGQKEMREELDRRQAEIEGQLHALKDQAKRLEDFLDLLAEPLQRLDESVESSIADLAVLLARHLVRRELRTHRGEVVAVVREALAHLPAASRHPRLRLHPEDLDLVRTALGLGDEEKTWRIEADPLISRGGCLVETETSFIDATVEARLNALIARMLGGERRGDATQPATSGNDQDPSWTERT